MLTNVISSHHMFATTARKKHLFYKQGSCNDQFWYFTAKHFPHIKFILFSKLNSEEYFVRSRLTPAFKCIMEWCI